MASKKPFSDVKARDKDTALTKRSNQLYKRGIDVRNEFERDYTRLLHSLGYRRLKNKTQVFFNTQNDHICTRIEHVGHVESVSSTIANRLGLNTALTRAIAIGHDIGHTPFGHQGEAAVSRLYEKCFNRKFFHEKNSLHFVDNVELLEDDTRAYRNLDLTYAVRDGIIAHCGEVNGSGIFPRKEMIDLKEFTRPGEYMPCTWEGCVVKISDRIAYIGRDIEDARRIGFIGDAEYAELIEIAKECDSTIINTTNIMNVLICDLCENSSPEKGIVLSESSQALMDATKKFNEQHIYRNEKFSYYNNYVDLIIESLFKILMDMYSGEDTVSRMWKKYRFTYRELTENFCRWVVKYCGDEDDVPKELLPPNELKNKRIYKNIGDKDVYTRSVIDFISGMTDRFAIKLFEELISF